VKFGGIIRSNWQNWQPFSWWRQFSTKYW